jgi:hypothetical protein
MSNPKLASLFAALLAACTSPSAPPPAQPPEPPPLPPAETSEPEPSPAPEPPPESPPAPEAPPASSAGVPDAWRACSTDADCVLVETACCDHCNGGKAVAVNKSHTGDAEKLRPQCGPTMCTKRACFTRAACESGACTLKPGMP